MPTMFMWSQASHDVHERGTREAAGGAEEPSKKSYARRVSQKARRPRRREHQWTVTGPNDQHPATRTALRVDETGDRT